MDNDVLVANLNRWSSGLGLPRTIIIIIIITYHQSVSLTVDVRSHAGAGKSSLINRVFWAKEAVRGHTWLLTEVLLTHFRLDTRVCST